MGPTAPPWPPPGAATGPGPSLPPAAGAGASLQERPLRAPDAGEHRSTTADRLIVAGTMVVAVLLIVSRRPDAILHPQFWAEDGYQYWSQAYEFGGLHVLFRPEAGYLQLFPRLAAALFVHFPLQWVPAFFSLSGILVQALPAPLLVS